MPEFESVTIRLIGYDRPGSPCSCTTARLAVATSSPFMAPMLDSERTGDGGRIPGVDAHLTDEDGHITLLQNRLGEVHAWPLEHFQPRATTSVDSSASNG
jgi:hypothetical protein